MLPAQPNESLIDGIRCLRALVVGRGPVGAREMARRLQIEPTRVHRLLKTLAHIGLVRQDSERKFRPGAGIRVLGAQSILGWELLKRCVGLLGEIPRRHPHSVAVGVLWEGTVSYLARGEPERWEEGLRMTTECVEASETALGMALLSGVREEEVERIYRGATVPGIPEGIPRLLSLLREIRSVGYVYLPLRERPGFKVLAMSFTDGVMGLEVTGRIKEEEKAEIIVEVRQLIERIESRR